MSDVKFVGFVSLDWGQPQIAAVTEVAIMTNRMTLEHDTVVLTAVTDLSYEVDGIVYSLGTPSLPEAQAYFRQCLREERGGGEH